MISFLSPINGCETIYLLIAKSNTSMTHLQIRQTIVQKREGRNTMPTISCQSSIGLQTQHVTFRLNHKSALENSLSLTSKYNVDY